MKAKTLQIVWHGKEPVFTLDFHPTNPALLATGGADKDIKIWEVRKEADGAPAVEYVSSVGGLTSAVNIVRFSPTGETMASGGNTGEMILWRAVDPSGPKAAVIGADGPAPTWKTCGALRGHADDVHDLAWSPDGSALVSGGVENICILWDVEAKRGMLRMENHQHYVQGVAWDPLGHYVCSQSNDRTCKVYGSKPPAAGKKGLQAPSSSAAALREFVVTANISKRVCAGVDTNNAAGMGSAPPAPAIKYPMFMDENISSFFRRLSWSPDGSFMAVPTGLHRPDASSSAAIPTTYIFARGDWSAPVAHLPSAAGRAPVVARFSPVLYALLPSTSPNNHNHCQHLTLGASSKQEHQQQQQQQQQQPSGDAAAVPLPEAAPLSEGRPSLVGSQQGNEEGSEGGSAGNGEAGGGDGGVVTPAVSPFMLPYRMVLAVATLNSVLVYDTQSLKPLALLGGLHMAPITDLAWSADGCSLAVSSQDGYCSLAVFEPGELGTPLQPHEMPSHVADTMQRTQAHKWAERCQQQAAAKAAAKQHQYSQHQQNQQQLQQQQDSQQQQQQQQDSQQQHDHHHHHHHHQQQQDSQQQAQTALDLVPVHGTQPLTDATSPPPTAPTSSLHIPALPTLCPPSSAAAPPAAAGSVPASAVGGGNGGAAAPAAGPRRITPMQVQRNSAQTPAAQPASPALSTAAPTKAPGAAGALPGSLPAHGGTGVAPAAAGMQPQQQQQQSQPPPRRRIVPMPVGGPPSQHTPHAGPAAQAQAPAPAASAAPAPTPAPPAALPAAALAAPAAPTALGSVNPSQQVTGSTPGAAEPQQLQQPGESRRRVQPMPVSSCSSGGNAVGAAGGAVVGAGTAGAPTGAATGITPQAHASQQPSSAPHPVPEHARHPIPGRTAHSCVGGLSTPPAPEHLAAPLAASPAAVSPTEPATEMAAAPTAPSAAAAEAAALAPAPAAPSSAAAPGPSAAAPSTAAAAPASAAAAPAPAPASAAAAAGPPPRLSLAALAAQAGRQQANKRSQQQAALAAEEQGKRQRSQ